MTHRWANLHVPNFHRAGGVDGDVVDQYLTSGPVNRLRIVLFGQGLAELRWRFIVDSIQLSLQTSGVLEDVRLMSGQVTDVLHSSVTVPVNGVGEPFIGKTSKRLGGWGLGEAMIDGIMIP